MIQIDLYAWSRREEVVRYAAERSLDIDEAIEQLVNSGLSHQ